MALTPLDYEDIRQLHARYSFAIDFGDLDAFEACFTPDATFLETGLPAGLPERTFLHGRAELRAFLRDFYAAHRGHLRHWSSPPLIDGAGDLATGQALLMVLRAGSAPAAGAAPAMTPAAGVILTGRYRDRYRKADGRWYFTERIFSADPQPDQGRQPSADPLVNRWDAFVQQRRTP
jgi:ketosteroid isomerase-like protein